MRSIKIIVACSDSLYILSICSDDFTHFACFTKSHVTVPAGFFSTLPAYSFKVVNILSLKKYSQVGIF